MKSMKQESAANRTRSLVPMMLALVALAIVTGRSEASLEKLRGDMGAFSRQLKQWLADNGEKGIVPLSSFEVLPELGTDPSKGLAFILKQELESAGVPLERTANYGIVGRLSRYPARGPITSKTEFTIGLELKGEGKVVSRKDLKIVDEEARELITGGDTGVRVRGKGFFKGPYGVEILVDGKPRAGKIEKGLPFVVLKPNEQYTIRLINESAREAAVWVGIDGLSMFAFSEDKVPDGKWRDYKLLVPGRTGARAGEWSVKGWYFHNRARGSRKFRITEFPETGAFLKGLSAGDLGIITLQFWESSPRGIAGDSSYKSVEGPGTGFGEAFTQKYTAVQRELSDLKATITIRYDRN